jgi:hypothetical protein
MAQLRHSLTRCGLTSHASARSRRVGKSSPSTGRPTVISNSDARSPSAQALRSRSATNRRPCSTKSSNSMPLTQPVVQVAQHHVQARRVAVL